MTEMATASTVHDAALEGAVLGCLLSTPDKSITTAISTLTTEDFYTPFHQAAWEALTELWRTGNQIDPNSVRVKIESTHPVMAKDAALTIFDLIQNACRPGALGWYIDRLKQLSIRRNAAIIGIRLQSSIHNTDDPSKDLGETIAELQQLAKPTTTLAPLEDVVDTVLTEVDDIAQGRITPGLDTGFTDLDRMYQGMRAGQMIVVGARPGVGKTNLALAIARHVAIRQQKLVHFASLEMSKEELAYRLLSAESNVPLKDLRAGSVTDDQWDKLGKARMRIADATLSIDDSAAQSITKIHAQCKAMLQDGLALIIIDYLQLLESSRRDGSRYSEVTDISRSIKMCAKDLGVPVIVLSQLSRSVEQSSDKTPGLHSLRDSSAIEADADGVWLLSRKDDAFLDPAMAAELNLHVAKSRHSQTGLVVLANRGHVASIDSMARED